MGGKRLATAFILTDTSRLAYSVSILRTTITFCMLTLQCNARGSLLYCNRMHAPIRPSSVCLSVCL